MTDGGRAGAFDALPSLGSHISQAGHHRCGCGAPLVPYAWGDSELACYASGKRCCDVVARRSSAYERCRWRDPPADHKDIMCAVAWTRHVYWRELAKEAP